MTDVEIIQGGVLKVGDTGPPLRVQLIDEDGSPPNLTSTSATIRVRRSDGDSLKVDASTTVIDPDRGIVEYDWQSGDTDTVGTFDAEVETDDGTDTISYPNDNFFRVQIVEDLS